MAQNKKSWWGRNWGWFVPLGCVGIFVVVAGLFAIVAIAGFHLMRSSTPYQLAVAAAKADPRVMAALGTPIKEGYLFTGNVKEQANWSAGTSGMASSGQADFSIPIYGPKGRGTLRAIGTMSAGKWTFKVLSVTVTETGKFIDLNENPKTSGKKETKLPGNSFRTIVSHSYS